MLSIIAVSAAAGVFIICLLSAVIQLVKCVPPSQKEEMRQFDENQKTYRWHASYTTFFYSIGFCFICFIASLFVKPSVKIAPYFIIACILFTVTFFLCLCIWKDLFYVFSNMSLLKKKSFKGVMLFYIIAEVIICAAGIYLSHSAVFAYFLLEAASVLAIYITYSQRLKLDEESLTIDNSDFAR